MAAHNPPFGLPSINPTPPASRNGTAPPFPRLPWLDWTRKYPAIADALKTLPASQAYLDGELCGLRPDGTTAFDIIQNAAEPGHAAALVFFLFDLLFIDGEDLTRLPLIERKSRLAKLLRGAPASLQYGDHQQGRGPAFYKLACERSSIEGIISKRADAPYVPGDRGLWRKTKCLNEDEFVVVGWSDPEGIRPYLGSLLLGYYDDAGRLLYAGRAGSGIIGAELERLLHRLQPLAIKKMPLAEPPPRTSHFGRPLECPASIGCGPSWSRRSNTSPGPSKACCGRSSIRACARTSRPATFGGPAPQRFDRSSGPRLASPWHGDPRSIQSVGEAGNAGQHPRGAPAPNRLVQGMPASGRA